MKRTLNILIAFMFTLFLVSAASATLVQFSSAGNGTYNITGIASLDWDNLGSAVVDQNLLSASNGATTLNTFFATAAVNDTLTFAIHAQDRLTNFVGPNGNLASPGLVTNGSGAGYEVTTTLDATETAKVLVAGATPILQFTGINGTFQFFLDDSPNSNVDTGVGYDDGSSLNNPFLKGTVDSVSGTFTGGNVGNGSNTLSNTITYYDPNVIEVDPASSNVWLIGTSFQSTLNYSNATNYNAVNVGGIVGGNPNDNTGGAGGYGAYPVYKVQQGDLILNADAHTGFSAVPEPSTLLLLGFGLLGVAGVFRRKLS